MAVKEESIQLAIDLEQEGNEYYTKHARETTNPVSKKVLESLADQELEHIRVVKKIAEGKSVASEEMKSVDLESVTREVFEEFSGAEKESWKEEDTSIYDHALDLEEKLYNLYKDLKNDSENEEEEEFFDALMNEENKHYESLANVLYYYTDHERWMSESEGEIWGWMNV